MASVTQRIKNISQPRGGYLPIKIFDKIEFRDNEVLNETESIHPGLMGLCVDYLTRYIITKDSSSSFKISLRGATIIGEIENALELINKIKDLTDESITACAKICGYDVCYRAGPLFFKPVREINPDSMTIENIRIMVKRSLSFFEKFGPITKDGFTFEGGYTDLVKTGDGDFLTSDTLWDFKVSTTAPNKDSTLQLLIYYLMGKNSVHNCFDTIKKIAIFNPRLNIIYSLCISSIDDNIIDDVASKVIGYR